MKYQGIRYGHVLQVSIVGYYRTDTYWREIRNPLTTSSQVQKRNLVRLGPDFVKAVGLRVGSGVVLRLEKIVTVGSNEDMESLEAEIPQNEVEKFSIKDGDMVQVTVDGLYDWIGNHTTSVAIPEKYKLTYTTYASYIPRHYYVNLPYYLNMLYGGHNVEVKVDKVVRR